MSMFMACGLQLIISFFVILAVDSFLCLFWGMPPHIDKPLAWVYIIFWSMMEYFIFFRNKRYREIFNEIASQSGTPVMKKKFRNAKIFNTSVLIVDIILLFVSNYISRHK
jgi:Na+/H+ antiporter NhaC